MAPAMNEQLLPRHIQWRRQYDAQRYALHLSQPDLNRRIRDIVLNMLYLDIGAKVDLGPITNERAIWIEKWTHMLEEMQLRHGPYPAGFTREILHSEPFPDFASELAKKATKRVSSMGLLSGDVLIKFGKREHMKSLYERGSLRIQPADYFSQTDHNDALKDDELNRTFSLQLTRSDLVKVVKNPQDVPEITPALTDVRIQSPNYWLYCLSRSTAPRLFVDFNADSCVIIQNPRKFTTLLDQNTQNLSIGMHCGPISYQDPLLPKIDKFFVPFIKHFRFTYQDEYRYCWVPRWGSPRLAQIDIEIGSLKDFAELVEL
jgi:hypothetical protein